MNKLDEVKEQLNCVEEKFNANSFALDVLASYKKIILSLIGVILFLIIAIIGMVGFYFWHESQFETVSEETIVDGGNGTATYLENSKAGDINYGENN